MTDWSPIRSALLRARSAGVGLPVWWRDDDAVEPTAALDDLYNLSQSLGVPVHLAVIPKYAQPALADYVAERVGLNVMVHGWAHENHAKDGVKKSEFPNADVGSLRRAGDGLQRLKELFGNNILPVFVPPWNRASPNLVAPLAGLGYQALSVFGPRKNSPGLPRINTHIDPVFWRGDRGLVPAERLISQTADRINNRINGGEDATEPLGYLTHHLVHTPEINRFSERFLSELLEGGAVVADPGKDLA